jgi:hypothetical protein
MFLALNLALYAGIVLKRSQVFKGSGLIFIFAFDLHAEVIEHCLRIVPNRAVSRFVPSLVYVGVQVRSGVDLFLKVKVRRAYVLEQG